MPVKYERKWSASEMLAQMTLIEKLEYINGIDDFYIRPLLRFGLRGVRMTDGTLGLKDVHAAATAFPAYITLAASWDRELAALYGECVAKEFNANGFDVLLGPGVNHYRVPQCGRNFEYLGEDPYLAAELVVPYIKAVQDNGVAATVKHFVANNSDWHRKNSNSIVDRRTLEEIYFPPFEAAVRQAGVMALMTSYNLVNGEYAAESQELLQDILLDTWEFKGLILSDWVSNFHVKKSIESPLHLEMPGSICLRPTNVKVMLENGDIEIADIDKKVLKILEFVIQMHELRNNNLNKGRYRCEEHLIAARRVAQEGIVLLENKDILPIVPKKVKSIAVVGPQAQKTAVSGGGAALIHAVMPYDIFTALDTVCKENNYKIEVECGEEAIETSDLVLLCLGLNPELEGEFFDRPFELPSEQLALLEKIKQQGKKIIIVITAGGGLDLVRVHQLSDALIHQWYPGEQGCLALAEILFGLVNPSGKLPITIEKKFSDRSSSNNYLTHEQKHYTLQTQGSDGGSLNPINDLNYKEGVFSGYRHFVTEKINPLYPFGFGLSYTTFSYKKMVCRVHKQGGEVDVIIANTGKTSGKEVVQVYVMPENPPIPRPAYELKGFAKIELAPAEEKKITIKLPERTFSAFDPAENCWKIIEGNYSILIGASSTDIRLEKMVKI